MAEASSIVREVGIGSAQGAHAVHAKMTKGPGRLGIAVFGAALVTLPASILLAGGPFWLFSKIG